jgi:hypothetical protein
MSIKEKMKEKYGDMDTSQAFHDALDGVSKILIAEIDLFAATKESMTSFVDNLKKVILSDERDKESIASSGADLIHMRIKIYEAFLIRTLLSQINNPKTNDYLYKSYEALSRTLGLKAEEKDSIEKTIRDIIERVENKQTFPAFS